MPKVPEDMKNEVMAYKTCHNDNARSVAKLKQDISILQTDMLLKHQKLMRTLREKVPEISEQAFSINFEDMTIEIENRPPILFV